MTNTSGLRGAGFRIVLVVMVMVAMGPMSAMAQFIDTATPTPTGQAATGGDWGNLLPGRDASGSGAPQIVGDVYVLPSSGVEVVVGSGVTTDASMESDVPDQIIVETDAGLGAVAVLDGFADPLSTLEVYVAGFGETMDSVVEIDIQVTDDRATGVYRVETEGLTVYLYIVVDASAVSDHTVIEVVVAEAGDMESSIVEVRENVAINGVPVFADVNEQDVIEIIASDER